MLLIFVIYTLSFGLSLFNHGVYWDDWAVVVAKSPEFIQNIIERQMGNMTAAYILQAMSSFHSAIIPRVITFILYGFSGYFFYSILGSIKEIDKKTRWLLTGFFLLFPANDSRVVLTIMYYSLSHFLFYCGWWLLSQYYQHKHIAFRVLSLVLFFISFNVSSLLFFYIVVLAYIFYKDKYSVRRNIDFVMLPFVYFILKTTLFPPSGEYAGYNVITLTNVFSASYRSLGAYIGSFGLVFLSSLYSLFNISLVNTIWQAGTTLNLHPYVAPLSVNALIDYLVQGAMVTWKALYHQNTVIRFLYAVIATSSVYLCIKNHSTLTGAKRKDILFFFLGCIFFYLAVYPYYVVHKLPSVIEGFSDRHLLLVPLGASFMIVYGIKVLANFRRARPVFTTVLYAVCIVLFVNYHLRIQMDFLKDWYKQVAVMEEMKEAQEIHDHTTFLFTDNAMDLNVKHRPYAFYEYTGFMRSVFGDQRRFGANVNEYNTLNNFPSTELNNMKDYVAVKPEYLVSIDKGTYTLSDVHLMHLLYAEYFRKDAFNRAMNNIVNLSIMPL